MYAVNNVFKYRKLIWISMIFFLSSFIACKKDKIKQEYPPGTNENINTWILDSLKRYYLWNETLPVRPNLSASPKDFFAGVLNSADRFSYLVLPGDPASVPANSRSSYGFDYSVIKDLNTGGVIGVVKLVLSDSPASRNGLKRGDFIRSINGKELTAANAAGLQAELLSAGKVTLGLAEVSGTTWQDTRVVTLNTGITLDQREISRIVESAGKKIGYLSFHHFNPGLARSLKNVFAGFKDAGIAELVLDLRYNSGGQVAEAAGLCAMIAPGIAYASPFITYKGNKNGGVRSESFGTAATFDRTVNFNDMLANHLALSRVYVLGTGATASAAEVIINNLKPYMQVILIGEQTRGKDEASFLISDLRDPKQVKWEMHPIIYKLFNAAGNGNYSSGINPEVTVNEFSILPLLPFGSVDDPLFKAALTSITGKSGKAIAGLRPEAGIFLNAGSRIVLLDSRTYAAACSSVITHR